METPTSQAPSHPETRQRLIEAAGEVFAEVGFKAATVRDICQRAGANVAAVNYHFGDKEKLYAEVLRFASLCAMEKYKESTTADPSLTPEQRLAVYIRATLARVFDTDRGAWRGKLVAREMVDPTPALNELVDNDIRPMFTLLASIVTDIIAPAPMPAPDPVLVRRCVFSVVGQIMFYNHARPVIKGLFPGIQVDLDALAEHITTFSLAALHDIARRHASEK